MKYIYKLARKTEIPNLYKSWCINTQNDCVLYYKPGEVTKANFGKIFCFKTMREAIQYHNPAVSNDTHTVILRCTPLYAVTKPPKIIPFGGHTKNYNENFWKGLTNHHYLNKFTGQDAPKGTVCCRKIKVVNIVKQF